MRAAGEACGPVDDPIDDNNINTTHIYQAEAESNGSNNADGTLVSVDVDIDGDCSQLDRACEHRVTVLASCPFELTLQPLQ